MSELMLVASMLHDIFCTYVLITAAFSDRLLQINPSILFLSEVSADVAVISQKTPLPGLFLINLLCVDLFVCWFRFR